MGGVIIVQYERYSFMKKSLIFLCIFTIAFIAFWDAKDRIKELDSVAANTPSQVEMKQMINKPRAQFKNHVYDKDSSKLQPQNKKYNYMKDNGNTPSQNQFDVINERRNSINQKAN